MFVLESLDDLLKALRSLEIKTLIISTFYSRGIQVVRCDSSSASGRFLTPNQGKMTSLELVLSKVGVIVLITR